MVDVPNESTRRMLITLTEHEWRITWQVAMGHTNHKIATGMFIAPETLRYHLKNIRHKFGVKTTAEVGRIARIAGIFDTDTAMPLLHRPVTREEIEELAAELFRLMVREPRSRARSRTPWMDASHDTKAVYRRLATHSLAFYHHMVKADREAADAERETDGGPTAVPA